MQVHPETHRQDPDHVFTNKKGVEQHYERYSVEVTIKGDRRRVNCSTVWGDRLPLFGLAVRFSQGAKVWPGMADYLISKDVVVNLQPRIDKRGHFSLAGYWEDFEDKKVASQHNAV
jgi:hypothetical protein